MKKYQFFSYKICFLIVGSFMMGIGSQLAVSSTFGADIAILVWEGLERLFHLSLSQANIVFSLFFLAITFFYNKKYIGIGTILGPFLQSFAISLCSFIHMEHMNVLVRIFFMVVGITIIYMGCAIYAIADMGVGPYVGATLALHDRFHMSISRVKVWLDICCGVVALLMGVLPAPGPIISILISGPVMDGTLAFLKGLDVQRVLSTSSIQ